MRARLEADVGAREATAERDPSGRRELQAGRAKIPVDLAANRLKSAAAFLSVTAIL